MATFDDFMKLDIRVGSHIKIKDVYEQTKNRVVCRLDAMRQLELPKK